MPMRDRMFARPSAYVQIPAPSSDEDRRALLDVAQGAQEASERTKASPALRAALSAIAADLETRSRVDASTRTIDRTQRDVLFNELALAVYGKTNCQPGAIREALNVLPGVFSLLDAIGWEPNADAATYDVPLTAEGRRWIEACIHETEGYLQDDLKRHIDEIDALLAGTLDRADSGWYSRRDPTLDELRQSRADCQAQIDKERRTVAALRALIDGRED